MKWRGPLKLEEIIGVNDFGIKVGNKVKTLRVNMFTRNMSKGGPKQKEMKMI